MSLDSCKSVVDDGTDDHIGYCIDDFICDVGDIHDRDHFEKNVTNINLCSYLSLQLHSHLMAGTPWDQKELIPLLPENC